MENEHTSRVRKQSHPLNWEGIDSERQQAQKQERSAKKGHARLRMKSQI